MFSSGRTYRPDKATRTEGVKRPQYSDREVAIRTSMLRGVRRTTYFLEARAVAAACYNRAGPTTSQPRPTGSFPERGHRRPQISCRVEESAGNGGERSLFRGCRLGLAHGYSGRRLRDYPYLVKSTKVNPKLSAAGEEALRAPRAGGDPPKGNRNPEPSNSLVTDSFSEAGVPIQSEV